MLESEILPWLGLSGDLYRHLAKVFSVKPDVELLERTSSISIVHDLPDSSAWRRYKTYAAKIRGSDKVSLLPSLEKYYEYFICDGLLETYEYSFYTRKNDYACAKNELAEYYDSYPYSGYYGLNDGHIMLQMFYMSDLRKFSEERFCAGDMAAFNNMMSEQKIFYKRFIATWWSFFSYSVIKSADESDVEYYKEMGHLFHTFIAHDSVFMHNILFSFSC